MPQSNMSKRHQYHVAHPKKDQTAHDGNTKNKAAAGTNAQAKSDGAEHVTRGQKRRAVKEKASTGGKYILVVIGIVAMLLSVSAVACAGVLNQSQSQVDYHLTGGIAATVGSGTISEDSITRQIMSTRESMGYTDDADWAEYLVSSGMTPESYRENLIDSYVNQFVVQQAISDYNIKVTDDDVEDAWQDMVANYDSEQDLIDQLESMGMSEDSYKEQLRSNLAQQKLYDTVAQVDDPTDEEIVEYANENLATYNDARRSSHILIKVDEDADDATRQEAQTKLQGILDQINAGKISFADAAKENSEDTSAQDGGDVGWDKLNTFVTEYQDALNALQPGQVSGIVETSYGYHIIQCTDLWHVDDKVTSADQIPEDIRDQFSKTIKSTNQQNAYNEWLEQYKDQLGVTINPMPEDVPYNVDLDEAATNSSDAANEATSTDDATTTDDTTATDATTTE